jgi:hypothetical protein
MAQGVISLLALGRVKDKAFLQVEREKNVWQKRKRISPLLL